MRGNVIALYIVVIGIILFLFGTVQLLITYGDIRFDQAFGQTINQTYIAFLMFGPVILVIGLILFILERHNNKRSNHKP